MAFVALSRIQRGLGSIVLIGALAASPLLRAECAPAPKALPFTAPGLDAHFDDNGTLFVRDGDQESYFFGIGPPSASIPQEPPCIQSVQERDGAYFVVFTDQRWSNGVASSSQCGGGTESEVQWLRIVDQKIVARRKGLFESCHRNREGRFAWDGTTLRVSATGLSKESEFDDPVWRDIAWTFDAKQPQKGLIERIGEPHP